ncbi:PD-(D/E)XK nuclease family protein [Schaalia naturae]|uniref:PD-(D/E)XK nuclease family protein n=2 Tax=Schaalia naturae TaxID=635203 RepID=A0ABW2SMZ3_9ACTO
MSEIGIVVEAPRRDGDVLPPLDALQREIVAQAAGGSLVVRGAPGSGRSTCALAVFGEVAARTGSAVIWAPDRLRTEALEERAQRLAPQAVRPVRTPAAFAYLVVSTWRIRRGDPLGPLELVTGAQEDRILQDLLAGGGIEWPPSLPERMRAMPAFRMELRNLFARAGEAGVDGTRLEALGASLGRAEWESAGRLLARYEDGPGFALESRGRMQADTSRIQRVAARVLERWDRDAPARRVVAPAPVPEVVVVDDLQDCTASTVELLSVMAGLGTRVVAFADPDVAVASYRGGEPHLDLRLSRAIGAPMRELGDVHRGTPALRELARDVTQRVTTTGPAGRRRAAAAGDAGAGGGPPEGAERIRLHLAASEAQLGALTARLLRGHHLHDGVAWEDQAVIVRSSGDVDSVRRQLRRGGVPLAGARRAFAFSHEPATRALLVLVAGGAPGQAAEAPSEPEAEERLAALLVDSPYVAADPLDVHRALRALNARVVEAADGDEEDTDLTAREVTLADLLGRPQLADGVADPELKGRLKRASRMWAARSGIALRRPRGALWALWQAADVAEQWRAGALEGGADAPWFDDQLDAVIALFRVADVWEQRTPAGVARDFAEELLADDVPVDTLARTGQRPAGVEVATPAQAMGREWDVVCVLGLQDGRWPNPRLRDRVLRADLLADIASGRLDPLDPGGRGAAEDPRSARRAVLDDEMRLFAAAVTRSRRFLHLGAVRAENEAPSSFIGIALPHAARGGARSAGREDAEASPEEDLPLEEVPPALDLAGEAAALRHLASQPEDEPGRDIATTLLAVLAREGVVQADPSRWTGVGGVTTDALTEAPGPIALSPSKVQTARECTLRWLLASAGGDAPAGGAQMLGTLVHAIAQRHPHGSEEEMLADLHGHWDDLGFDGTTWVGREQRLHAEDVVRALASYVQGVPGGVQTEVRVHVPLGDVVLTGSIDRIEEVDGGVRIVDLKTGRAISADEAQEHPQLAAYQVALVEQGLDVVGARLEFLGSGRPVARIQPGLRGEDLERWRTELERFGTTLRGPVFQATPSAPVCRTCPFRRSCPAQDEGRRTVE